MAYQLGVDLGTTFTAAAVWEDDSPRMVSLGARAVTVPSVAFVTETGQLMFGEAAAQRARAEPDAAIREFKRRLGDPVPLRRRNIPLAAEHVMAQFLAWVVARTAERQGGPPDALVVTHPANWGPYRLEILGSIVAEAGLAGAGLLAEPQAAALHHAALSRVEPGELVAVYDLGGGTFDISILRKEADRFVVVGEPQGVDRLGGIDFDQALFNLVQQALGDDLADLDPTDPAVLRDMMRLQLECVEAKEQLSESPEAVVPVNVGPLRKEVRVTRGELEAVAAPLVEITLDALERALATASVTPAELTSVLLVGGASRMPLVGRMIGERLGRPVAVDTHPKELVALGAARAAAIGPRLTAVLVRPADGHEEVEPITPSEPDGEAVSAVDPPGTTDTPDTVAEDQQPAGGGEATRATERLPQPATDDAAGGKGSRRKGLLAVGGAALVAVVAVVALVAKGGSGGDGSGEGKGSASSASTVGTGAPAALDIPRSPAGLELRPDSLVFARQANGIWSIQKLSLATPATFEPVAMEPNAESRLPAVSPDRRTVAFTRSSAGKHLLVLTDVNGTAVKVLRDDLSADSRVAWSPDGRRLAYVTSSGGQPDLFVVDLAGGGVERLTNDARDEGDPTWSADGKQVILWRKGDNGRTDLYAVALADRTVTRLTTDENAADPALSPRGDQLAYSSGAGEAKHLRLVEIDPATVRPKGPPRDLTAAAPEGWSDEDPAWSPDATMVAFESSRPNAAKAGEPLRKTTKTLWSVSVADGKVNQLLAEPSTNIQPAWSSPGR